MNGRADSPAELDITCIPLFGHGKVEIRVENYLSTQLQQYKSKIMAADLIICVGHSQGCLVSVQLLCKLMRELHWIDTSRQNLTVLLLAGLHHGPFPDLPGDLYAATKELFTFSHADSDASRRHVSSLHFLVENGAKFLFVGSVHDQVVPLYSSLAQILPNNANIMRAFYVDYAHYAPDFLYALISLLLYMHNTSSGQFPQYSDLLVHLSGFCRGGLLSGAGGAHSAIHRLRDLYSLAVEFALIGPAEREIGPTQLNTQSYALWSAVLSDNFTHSRFNKYLLQLRARELISALPYSELSNAAPEINRLRALFQDWQPRLKAHKILKETLNSVFGEEEENNNTNSSSSSTKAGTLMSKL
jgi:hypothetical protein